MHPFEMRYRCVWDQTLNKTSLSLEDVKKSRYYFENDLSIPTPRIFDTFGVVALLPMPQIAQDVFSRLNREVIHILGNPLHYSVQPEHRHIELFLFSRPEEQFSSEDITRNIESSYKHVQKHPLDSFIVQFRHPFITPDGTIVVPGYPTPPTIIDELRMTIESVVCAVPKKQSQWLHISLGRILEPISSEVFRAVVRKLDSHWNEVVFTCEVNTLLWTHEKQWYMVEKEILHELQLKK